MYILLTFVLLAFSISIVAVLRMTRPSAPFVWLAAAGGALLVWVSVLLWQFGLPWQSTFGLWSPSSLFEASPQLLANSYVWLFALCISALAAAVILTSPVRASQNSLGAWLGTLALTALAVLALLADNPLALMLAWMTFDLTEFLMVMRAHPAPAASRAAVLSFSLRALGIALAMWARVVGVAAGPTFLFENTPQAAGIYLFLAVGLRLGVAPLYRLYPEEPASRRDYGTILRLTGAATTLAILAHLPAKAVDPRWLFPALLLAVLAALYGGWRWFFSTDELSGRPYWVLGVGALSLAASLSGNPAGAVAWGTVLVLFGGLSALYSAKQPWFTRAFVLVGFLMLALPFTLTAGGWTANPPIPWLLWPLLLAGHALLAGGYARHLARPAETNLEDLPSWAQAVYPIGMGLLVVTILLAGLWGWVGALNQGVWLAGLLSFLLYAAIVFVALRRQPIAALQALRAPSARGPRFLILLSVFPRAFLSLYQLTGDLLMYIARLLEGDGGLLWTLLLLVLLTIFLRGR